MAMYLCFLDYNSDKYVTGYLNPYLSVLEKNIKWPILLNKSYCICLKFENIPFTVCQEG